MTYWGVKKLKNGRRILNFCVWSWVTYRITFQSKKKSRPPPTPRTMTYWGVKKLKNCRRILNFCVWSWVTNRIIFQSKKKSRPPPYPPHYDILGGNKNWKIVVDFWNLGYDFWGVGGDVWRQLCRHTCRKISASADGGLSGGSRVRGHGSEDPHRR